MSLYLVSEVFYLHDEVNCHIKQHWGRLQEHAPMVYLVEEIIPYHCAMLKRYDPTSSAKAWPSTLVRVRAVCCFVPDLQHCLPHVRALVPHSLYAVDTVLPPCFTPGFQCQSHTVHKIAQDIRFCILPNWLMALRTLLLYQPPPGSMYVPHMEHKMCKDVSPAAFLEHLGSS